MSTLTTVLFLIVGIVNGLPVVGAVSARHLTSLYGVEGFTADIELLLRHRAVLFGIVGLLLVYAAFQPTFRTAATIAGIASMVSFCVLAYLLQTSNPSLIRIAQIDVLASLVLLLAFALHLSGSGRAP